MHCVHQMMVLRVKNTLLLCPSFDTQRRSLLDRTLPLIRPLGITNPSNELLKHTLLCGCTDLPADSNREILQATLSFIRETGRFNRHVNNAKNEFP